MERKFLESLGLEADKIDKIMAEHGKSTEKVKEQVTNVTSERDGLKAQLEEVSKSLEAFKGTDPEALKKEIETLKSDIAKKDADYTAQLADRDFQAAVNTAVAANKGKNPKAILALLDVEKLKSSKNQEKDITEAIKSLRESDSYLFEEQKDDSGKQATTPAKMTTGGTHNEDGGTAPQDTNAHMNALIRGQLEGD